MLQKTRTGTQTLLQFIPNLWRSIPNAFKPMAVIGLAILISIALFSTKPRLEPKTIEVSLPSVSIITAKTEQLTLTVNAQGSVVPRTESNIIPEVNGRITWISPAFVVGGYIEEGEILLRIDDADYRDADAHARAALIKTTVDEELALSELSRLKKLLQKKLASQSQVDEAKRTAQVAKASLMDSKTTLRQTARDLKRTQLLAPFSGRIRSAEADVGQFVSRGELIGSVYATDSVEVRLPIIDSQLAYLDIPLGSGGNLTEEQQANVIIHGEYAGQTYQWKGKLVRTEAELDSDSRMLYGVVRVNNELSENQSNNQPPLMVGMFVNAEITGRVVNNIVRIPRSALYENSRLLILDENDQLAFRAVKVLRIEQDSILINEGLQGGERICVSEVPFAVEGVKVEPIMAELL
jgi:RND family efflux transporter MFP subunit